MRDAAREAAVSLLTGQRLHSLFVDVTRLKYDKNIIFVSIRDFCRSTSMTEAETSAEKNLKDGCTLVREAKGKTRYIVLYNERQGNARRRAFTLAHEVGHIYLGHRDDDDANEAQANRFASELLMPECLLWEYLKMNGGKMSAEELCSVFNISRRAAETRLRLCKCKPDGIYDARLLKKLKGFLPDAAGPVVTI